MNSTLHTKKRHYCLIVYPLFDVYLKCRQIIFIMSFGIQLNPVTRARLLIMQKITNLPYNCSACT